MTSSKSPTRTPSNASQTKEPVYGQGQNPGPNAQQKSKPNRQDDPQSDNNLPTVSPAPRFVSVLREHPAVIYELGVCAGASGALFGYNTAVINGASLLIKKEFNLDDKWLGFIVSSPLATAAICAFGAGILSDTIGRKRSIILSALVFVVGGVLMGVANGPYMLLIGRSTVGGGIGLVSAVVPVYVSECSPANIRGFLVTLFQLFITFGIWLSSVSTMICYVTDLGWRYMLGMSAILGVIQFLLMSRLGESPRYQVMKGDLDGAQRTLKQIRESDDVSREMTGIVESFECQPNFTGLRIYCEMFKTAHVRRAVYIGCMVHLLQQFCGVNGIIYYSSLVMKSTGFDLGFAILRNLNLLTVNFIITFLALWSIEAIGRKASLVYSFIGMAFTLIVLVLVFLPNYIKPVPTAREFEEFYNFTDHCSEMTNCWQCVNQDTCGYCGVRAGDTSMVNGSCVPATTETSSQEDFSSSGRCQRDALTDKHIGGEDMFYSYSVCPIDLTTVAISSILLFVVFFAPGAGPVPWTLNAEIYPLWCRSVAASLAAFTNWTCDFILSVSFLPAVKTIKIWGIFLVFVCVCVVGAIFSKRSVPETRRISLEEMEQLFLNRPYLAQAREEEEEAEEEEYVDIDEHRCDCHDLIDNDVIMEELSAGTPLQVSVAMRKAPYSTEV